METIGNPKPWIGTDLGTSGEPEPEPCSHQPETWNFDEKHHAFLISECEKCGAALLATDINNQLLKDTGEIQVTGWVEEG